MRGLSTFLALSLFATTLSASLMAVSVRAQTIQVAALSDIDFGQTTPTIGTLRRRLGLCVAMETPGAYRVSARGTGPGGEFALKGGVAPLPFGVRFSDRRNGRGRVLPAMVELAGFQSRLPLRRSGCRRLNALLTISLPGAALAAAAAGRYSGSLLVTVSPE
ncbi:MAG: hypothetical protein AAF610_02765 [Pseudomonadota bacterium]